ncbi:hypothetical protein BDR04DRAFT_800145 [Suillus decipiens]|nr:hypothetical protein BDR04DRAFT_800145 [Suillus decipiens]
MGSFRPPLSSQEEPESWMSCLSNVDAGKIFRIIQTSEIERVLVGIWMWIYQREAVHFGAQLTYFLSQSVSCIELPLSVQPSTAIRMTHRDASGHARKLLYYLDILVASQSLENEGDTNANFMAKLLETLGHDDHRRIIFICHPLPLTVCGTSLSAEMGISIIEDNEILMLVCSEDKERRSDAGGLLLHLQQIIRSGWHLIFLLFLP